MRFIGRFRRPLMDHNGRTEITIPSGTGLLNSPLYPIVSFIRFPFYSTVLCAMKEKKTQHVISFNNNKTKKPMMMMPKNMLYGHWWCFPVLGAIEAGK